MKCPLPLPLCSLNWSSSTKGEENENKKVMLRKIPNDRKRQGARPTRRTRRANATFIASCMEHKTPTLRSNAKLWPTSLPTSRRSKDKPRPRTLLREDPLLFGAVIPNKRPPEGAGGCVGAVAMTASQPTPTIQALGFMMSSSDIHNESDEEDSRDSQSRRRGPRPSTPGYLPASP